MESAAPTIAGTRALPAQRHIAADPIAAEGAPTLLIVDDMPANLDILVHMLKDRYTLRVARDGRTALEIAARHRIDLVLLDVMMPQMNGFEVCRALKADAAVRDVPVIFISALKDAEHQSAGFFTGAVDYITKPFIPAVVEARIARQLELARQRRRLELTVAQQSRDLQESRLEVLKQLARAAELRDNETGLHVVRVAHYSYAIARAAGIDEETAASFRLVAPLHDVGKIGVPDHILLKAGPLTDEEWEVIRTHCDLGYRIIGEEGGELTRLAALCAWCHHEKWDGSGYPRALSGEAIPLVARVLAVADVFDALTTARPYKHAFTTADAVQIIRNGSGTHFDPALVHAFLEALPEIEALKETLRDLHPAEPTVHAEALPCPATPHAKTK